MMNSKPTSNRIATVTATGKRFMVQSIHFGTGATNPSKVHCWGDVVGFKFRGDQLCGPVKYDGSKTFLLEAVTIADVTRSATLMESLLEQTKTTRREAGHIITGGRRAVDHGTHEQANARANALTLLKGSPDDIAALLREQALGASYRAQAI